MKLSNRYPGLDGLRGLAALTVFVGHAVGMAPPARVPSLVTSTPLHALWDGTAAVVLFFVLSGFVLALPFVGDEARPLRAGPFVVKRVCRIYPAYWAALVLAIVLQRYGFASENLAGASVWFRHFWHAPPSLHELLAHALMIGPSFDWVRIDPVIWSLVVEMRISLLYPLVIVALGRCRNLPSALGLFAVALGLSLVIATLTYLPMFVLGGLVARFRAPLFRLARALPRGVTLGLVAVALILFDVRFALGATRLPYRVADHVIAAGSALLVLLVAARPGLAQPLSRGPIAFLGAVSYSFYLVHLPILLAAASLVGRWPHGLWLAPPLALFSSLAMAWIFQRGIERPFQALGRTLARPAPALATCEQC